MELRGTWNFSIFFSLEKLNFLDLLHLLENSFDPKCISVNPNPKP